MAEHSSMNRTIMELRLGKEKSTQLILKRYESNHNGIETLLLSHPSPPYKTYESNHNGIETSLHESFSRQGLKYESNHNGIETFWHDRWFVPSFLV